MKEINFGKFDKINVNAVKVTSNAADSIKNKLNLNNVFVEPDYSVVDYSDEEMKKFESVQKQQSLNNVLMLAEKDSQINTSGNFDNFSDFQNVMMSDMCLLELLFENSDENINGKSISELYMDYLSDNSAEEDYEKLMFTGDDWLKMADSDNWGDYRSKALGKMVRYGFGDIKIKEFYQGENGFDAYVLEDTSGNLMVYYPCTNLAETEDFLYDSYNIIENVTAQGETVGKVIRAKQIYDSQQLQAKAFLEKCIANAPDGKKVNVFGFSLGGSLAESAYLNSMDKHSSVLGDIVLYNPYHDNLSSSNANKLLNSGKLKIYACEGDMVSTVFNYKEFAGATKSIYIDSSSNMNDAKKYIDNDDSLFNKVLNHVKNNYCDDLISDLNSVKERIFSWDIASKTFLNNSISVLENIKDKKFDAVGTIKGFGNVVHSATNFLDKIGINVSEKYDLTPFQNLHYLEYIFTDSHLPYSADAYKNVSFGQNGEVLNSVSLGNDSYNVSYPSFGTESEELFGTDIYSDVSGFFDKFNK